MLSLKRKHLPSKLQFRIQFYPTSLTNSSPAFIFASPFEPPLTFSNSQLGLHAPFNPAPTLIIIQSRLHPLLNKLLHLLRRPPHKALRVKEGVKVSLNWVEVRIGPDPFDEIVLESELLYLVRGFMRQNLITNACQTVSQARVPE